MEENLQDANFAQLIGHRLREERVRLGLKMKDMTARLELSRNMWSRYEKGATPGLKILATCAQHGFDIGYLLTGHRSPIFLTSEEALLLARFRTAAQDDRKAALNTLA